MHWFFVKGRFDNTRKVTIESFMKKVVRNKLLNIIEEKRANKRAVSARSFFLDEILDEEKSIEKILGIESDTLQKISDAELFLALSKVFARLSVRQKELCRLLGKEQLNVSQASQRLSVPRRTLRDEILRIREVFRKEGLEDYLG